jgi:hypothetical protein
MTAGERPLLLDEVAVVPRITTIIWGTHELEYTMPLRVCGSFDTFGCYYFDEILRLNRDFDTE